jgi:hypothetical protein
VVKAGAFSQYRRGCGSKWTKVTRCDPKDKEPEYHGSRTFNDAVVHESAYSAGRGDPADPGNIPDRGDDCMACGKPIVGGQDLTGLCANPRKRGAVLNGCQSAEFQDIVLRLTNSTGEYHFDDTPALRGAVVSYADTRITALGDIILQFGP